MWKNILKLRKKISSAWVLAVFENKQRLQQLANLEGMVYNKLDGVV
jgi:hypothetical protein